MQRGLLWIILALVLIGLVITSRTQSPQKPSSDRSQQASVIQSRNPVTAPSKAPQRDSGSRLLTPGKSAGAITAKSGMTDLIRIYGEKNVKAEDIQIGEGDTVPGAVIFPDKPEHRLELIWKDAKTRIGIESVRFDGEKSRWRTSEGITLGTSLKELETLNGGAFTLAGFGWDYGGTVFSWGDHGKLYDRFQKTGSLVLRLSPALEDESPEAMQLAGDREFSSSHPAMQKVNPRVYQLIMMLE